MQNELHCYWDFFHYMLVKVVNLLQQTHHRVLGDAESGKDRTRVLRETAKAIVFTFSNFHFLAFSKANLNESAFTVQAWKVSGNMFIQDRPPGGW